MRSPRTIAKISNGFSRALTFFVKGRLPNVGVAERRARKPLKLSRRRLTLAASVALSAIIGAAMPAAPAAAADDQEIAEALRAGGLIIVVRPGATFSDQA